jgi:hypothetical protein
MNLVGRSAGRLAARLFNGVLSTVHHSPAAGKKVFFEVSFAYVALLAA